MHKLTSDNNPIRVDFLPSTIAFGAEALPGAWAERVELRDTIERLAGDLYAVAVSGVELDYEAYPPN